MFGYMTGSEFVRSVGWRIGLLVAFTLGFPFIVYAIVVATGASRVGGAAGGIALMAGLFLKPVIVTAFLIAMISPCWKRMRSLDMPSVCGLLVPFLLIVDFTYLFTYGNFWGASFSLGIMGVSAPLFCLTALALIVAMVVATPPSSEVSSSSSSFRLLGKVTAALAIAVVIVGLVALTLDVLRFWIIWHKQIDPPTPASRAFMKYLGVVLKTKPYVCGSLAVALLWLAFVSRRNSDDETSAPIVRETIMPSPKTSSPPAVFGKR